MRSSSPFRPRGLEAGALIIAHYRGDQHSNLGLPLLRLFPEHSPKVVVAGSKSLSNQVEGTA